MSETFTSHVEGFTYPTSAQAFEASKTLIAKLKGEAVELNCLLQCAYIVEGFALAVAFPHPATFNAGTVPEGLETNVAKIRRLAAEQGIAPPFAADPAQPRGAFPWLALLPILKQLFDLWLNSR
jgi:hypothetical protein